MSTGGGWSVKKWNTEELLKVRWQAAAQTTIGGWCVQPEGEPPPHEGGIAIADFVARDHAVHIAQLHNDSLEKG